MTLLESTVLVVDDFVAFDIVVVFVNVVVVALLFVTYHIIFTCGQ